MPSAIAIPTEPIVLYEDDDLIVLNKPCGIHSVRQKQSAKSSLADWLIERDSKQAQIGKINEDAGLLQRLDFETSGLILAAKNNSFWEKLRALLMQGQITKSYYCLVEGKLDEDKIEVNSFIGSPYRNAKKVRVYKNKPGKPHRALAADTIFEFLKLWKSKKISLLKVHAKTARRHQIRAHAASLGHPLVGDTLYGSSLKLPVKYPVDFFLQASFLSFVHPISNKKLEFEIELPKELEIAS